MRVPLNVVGEHVICDKCDISKSYIALGLKDLYEQIDNDQWKFIKDGHRDICKECHNKDA